MKIKICWPFVRRTFFFSSANKIFLVQVKDAVNIRVTYFFEWIPALHSVSLCKVVEGDPLELNLPELAISPIDELKHALNAHSCRLAIANCNMWVFFQQIFLSFWRNLSFS